jgi:hypothetical protein
MRRANVAGKYTEGRFVYEGEFDEDSVTGRGKFSYPSGSSYEGQWVNGVYSGHGKYSWPDGRSYEVCGSLPPLHPKFQIGRFLNLLSWVNR